MEAEPVIVTTVFFMSVVLIWGGFILTRHKERMTMIEKALKKSNGVRSEAARILGVKTSAFYYKLEKYNLLQ